MQKKILCTGSGGFIFSNFIRKVLKDNDEYKIVSIDKITNSSAINTIYANKGHTLYIGDVVDSHFVNTIFEIEKPDIVIHGAYEDGFNSKELVTTNIVGTQVMIHAAENWGVERFVYTSTYKVYDELKSEDSSSWTEGAPINPLTIHDASKASGELLIKASKDLPYNILRLSNNYGPRQQPYKFIPQVVSTILSKNENFRPVRIFDNGMQLRDWIHVQDTCDAILTVLDKAPIKETYNISSGQEFTTIEVYHEINKILNMDHNYLIYLKEMKEPFRYATTNDKIKELGWSPKFKLKSGGLQHTVDWFEKNRWFLKSKEE